MQKNNWLCVTNEKIQQWQLVFSRKELFIPQLIEPCPICGEIKLRRYYEFRVKMEFEINGYFFIGKGGGWEWCSNCHTYLHFSASIPKGWLDILDGKKMKSFSIIPDEIEKLYNIIGL